MAAGMDVAQGELRNPVWAAMLGLGGKTCNVVSTVMV
jgi:hypothetical protein